MMEFTVRFDHFVSPHDFGVEEGPVCFWNFATTVQSRYQTIKMRLTCRL